MWPVRELRDRAITAFAETSTVKPPPFEYHAVTSLDEATALLSEYGDEAKVLAGGQSLLPLLALRLARPEHLVDINRVEELATIDTSDGLRLGATVRQRTIERSAEAAVANPLLRSALPLIGHAPIRNRGTVAGSIAHGDPAAELPAVLSALGGTVEATSARGTRTIGAVELYTGFLTTSLSADELITAVYFPPWTSRTGGSFREFSRRSGDFAVAGVAAVLSLNPMGVIADARLALSGIGATPIRATDVEVSLRDQVPSDSLWSEAAAQATAVLDPPSDLHGSATYRRHLVGSLIRRALREAHDRAAEAQ